MAATAQPDPLTAIRTFFAEKPAEVGLAGRSSCKQCRQGLAAEPSHPAQSPQQRIPVAAAPYRPSRRLGVRQPRR